MAVDFAGCVTLVGFTAASDFPVTAGAFDTTWEDLPLAYEGFVTKFTPQCDALVFSTFLGGTNQDYTNAVDVDDSGAVTVAGVTGSSNFPITPGAFDSQVDPFGGNRQYVARLDPTGSSLLFSTYFGGLEIGPEEITDIAVDITGATTLAGYTDKADFPVTPGVYDPFLYDAYDAFVSRLDPTGSALIFSTLFGFASSDEAYALVRDTAGAPTIAGTTWSEDMPTTPGTFQAEKVGPWQDGFLARFSPDASELLYSTYLGGSDKEWEGLFGYQGDLALAPEGEIYTVGTTRSADIPTTAGAFDTTYGGDGDGFIVRLDMLPTGVVKYGSASAACQGPIAIGALQKPQANALLLTSTNGPPLAQGFLVVGTSAEMSGISLLGASLHVSPFELFAALPVQANALGYASLQLSFPPLSTAARGFVQFLWLGTPTCGGAGTLSASNGLALALPL